MPITIYHNPACSTSRKVPALIRKSGVEPRIILYLETPPTRPELETLIARLNIPVRDILRRKAPPYTDLNLANPTLPDTALLDAIMAHPVLIERPIVTTPKGAKLCRPPGSVLEIL